MVAFLRSTGSSLVLRRSEQICSRQRVNVMSAAGSLDEEPMLQYVLVRRDLMTDMQWPLGSVITQGVHAAVGALWTYREDEDTKKYCSQSGGLETSASFSGDISNQMHTVVLGAKNEAEMIKLAETLDNADKSYALWREHPENICTALATKPYHKSEIQPYFKKFRLLK
ncbi:hypothetical protein NDN08_001414 [Rhodosorus marinus]|uniref:peptidyl-tRNA hydrolase n=1 Tax=Rhodosorus marinus TaxID=101924 RepID=A0AAV8UQQ5_9RHOD|nr:hypothetical protein NDN08_001414 [Rhodosorus marinus]